MAIRTFNLIGRTHSNDAACTITINGIEVFSGALQQVTDDDLPICTGSVEVGDDSVDVILPVVITMTAGVAGIGMFKFNYGPGINPTLSPEEVAYVVNAPNTPIPRAISNLIETKGGMYVPSPEAYAYGKTAEEYNTNRYNITVDGNPISVPGYFYQYIISGQVLAFDQLIFTRL